MGVFIKSIYWDCGSSLEGNLHFIIIPSHRRMLKGNTTYVSFHVSFTCHNERVTGSECTFHQNPRIIAHGWKEMYISKCQLSECKIDRTRVHFIRIVQSQLTVERKCTFHKCQLSEGKIDRKWTFPNRFHSKDWCEMYIGYKVIVTCHRQEGKCTFPVYWGNRMYIS